MGIFKSAYINYKDEMMPYFYWLASINEIGIKTYTRMQSYFGSPKAVFEAEYDKLSQNNIFTKRQLEKIILSRKDYDPVREYERIVKEGIIFIPYESEDYPENLKELTDCPIALFLLGKMLPPKAPTVAIIGARECSQYGKMVSKRLGEVLAFNGISVVSGMARGIDSIAQRSAVEAGGYSMAVLGGGPDYIYPKESTDLYNSLLHKGGIISEYAPGTAPLPQFFAQRNRIISGLADIVCVVEARKKSGTMITVDCALEQGREVYVVPGRITDVTSQGCNELIRQGAGIVTDIEEFALEIKERFSERIFNKDAGAENEPRKNSASTQSVNIFTKDAMDKQSADEFTKNVVNKQSADEFTKNVVNKQSADEFTKTVVNKHSEHEGLLNELSDSERRIIVRLSEDSFTLDEMAIVTGIPVSELLLELIELCKKDICESLGAGRFTTGKKGIIIRNLLLSINQNNYI